MTHMKRHKKSLMALLRLYAAVASIDIQQANYFLRLDYIIILFHTRKMIFIWKKK